MIATTPGATDRCICGHDGLAHDATSQVCRFQKDTAAPCGCVSFGYVGAMSAKSPVVGNTPALAGPAQGTNKDAGPLTGNRNG